MAARFRSLLLAIAAAILVGGSASAQVTIQAERPLAPSVDVSPTTKTLFSAERELMIPYRWSGAAGGAKVVLYQSTDQGANWHVAGSAAPHVRSFRFLAPTDGTYCFAIRTYDQNGVARPRAELSPEMQVAVDTLGPQVERFDAEFRSETLEVSIEARDASGFGTATPNVYAQVAGDPSWTPLTATDIELDPAGQLARITATWHPPAGAREIALRAVIEDRAGNRTERTATATQAEDSNRVATGNGPFGYVSSTTRSSRPTTTKSTGIVDPFAAAEQPSGSRTQPKYPQTEGASLTASDSETREWRDSNEQRDVASESTPWPVDETSTRSLTRSESSPTNKRGGPFSSASFSPTEIAPFPGWEEGRSKPPAIRFVNTRQFEFDYELERTGRWGVAKVELWGTQNNGRSWRRFAIDSDRESPIHVNTPGEGSYGFRLVVESVGGLEPATPRPGDKPEAMVGVDLTAPYVALSSIRQGVGYFADQLVIQWQADDEQLAKNPIDLYYSNRQSGPWIPIATAQPNSGRHSWRLQRHLPQRLFVRIEARDKAGNKTSATTPDSIELNMATAAGSLLGVRPSGR